MESALQHGTTAFVAGIHTTRAAAILLKEMGHGDMENAARFPHLHTPDGDYELLSKKALH